MSVDSDLLKRQQELLKLSKEELVSMILQLESNLCNDLAEPPLKKRKLTQMSGNVENETENINKIEKKDKKDKKNKKSKKKNEFDISKYSVRFVGFKFCYVGHKYHGLIRQECTLETIEEKIFDALLKSKLIINKNEKDNNYSRCGRTDKGVSSLGNVFACYVRSKIYDPNAIGMIKIGNETSNDKSNDNKSKNNKSKSKSKSEWEYDYCKILNALLPNDIRILYWIPIKLSNELSNEFSARFSCHTRIYKYLFYGDNMNISAMKQGASNLIGTFDFRNFCKMDVINVKNFIRQIKSIDIWCIDDTKSNCNNNDNCNSNDSNDVIAKYDQLWVITIEGNAFLWHQIRCIVSILMLIGRNLESPNVIKQLLNVNENKHKPQYDMASEIPLILYDCLFNDDTININNIINSQICKQRLKDVINTLHCQWREKMLICQIYKLFWTDACQKLLNLENNDNMSQQKCSNQKEHNDNDNEMKQASFDYYQNSELLLKQCNLMDQMGYQLEYRKNLRNNNDCNYIPLMKRKKEMSYKEKVDSLSDNKKDKLDKKEQQRQYYQKLNQENLSND